MSHGVWVVVAWGLEGVRNVFGARSHGIWIGGGLGLDLACAGFWEWSLALGLFREPEGRRPEELDYERGGDSGARFISERFKARKS